MPLVRSKNDRREVDRFLRSVFAAAEPPPSRQRRFFGILQKVWYTTFMTIVALLPLWVYLFFRPERNRVSILHDVGVVTLVMFLAMYQCLGVFILPFVLGEIWKPFRMPHRPVR